MSSIRNRQKQFLLICVLWAVFLSLSAIQPHWLLWKLLPAEALHAAAHVAAYGLFAYFLCFWLLFNRSFAALKMTEIRVYWTAFCIALAWGCVNEALQFFRPDRQVDIFDIMWNSAGALAGIIAYGMRLKLVEAVKKARRSKA